MDLTIIIPNHNDLRMIKMIESIDYRSTKNQTVELLILLNNPTKEVIRQCNEIKIRFKKDFLVREILTDIQNLGYLYNLGIKNASFEHIMFLDSDLICGNNSIELMVSQLKKNKVELIKAKLIYTNMNGLVEKARLVNTTEKVPPYIPVILLKKSIFFKFKDNFLFAIDVVWCSDAEFAHRVINENIPYIYSEAEFFHDKISLKKDIKDAFLYGFGKGIRVKRTREKWEPFNEIISMRRKGKKCGLTLRENSYSVFWITMQQLACLIQQFIPPVFTNSLDFRNSTKREEIS
ncbi:glycosyltransferase family 2 protein [Enterococcus sp. ALS3]|uniref:Glycosyltransferase family 2 protein n=1 Tax=Enterococcus alishanensis TaxID=1303817 RepID=A0ABS6THV5_9ENTE|nr:glycosyltransferase family A protein [Enterococcus alishanensis]MBV7392472.1 glycosyltransferase family 2 protein [Enterococcus alishanensis]